MAAKWIILNSITKSKPINGNNAIEYITGHVMVPDQARFVDKTLEEIKDLRISQVQWYANRTLGFTLTDEQSCKTGTYRDIKDSHVFNPTKKITKIDCIIDNNEDWIIRINFYSGQERLVTVGLSDEDVEDFGGRVETFEIADYEQLIGCELYHSKLYFAGITWLKIKVK